MLTVKRRQMHKYLKKSQNVVDVDCSCQVKGIERQSCA
jgi:hypothetical protein